MRRTLFTSIVLSLSSSLALGCSSPATSEDVGQAQEDLVGGRAGAVYTLSNAADSNEVIVYRRGLDGALQRAASYATAGKGSADGLGSQGALTLSANGHWLFAVNAGSNGLSTFYVSGETLYLVDVVATGGTRPVSVAEHGGTVYVAHAGGVNGITGFTQGRDGALSALPGSTRPLSAGSVGPAQVSFSPSGHAIVVTEKMTNMIDEFRVDPATGLAGPLIAHTSNGQTPFGFAVTHRGQVIVSEAFGGMPDKGAASSYQLGGASGLTSITTSSQTGEAAPCWVVLARSDRFAYVSNTASGTISRYSVSNSGALSITPAADQTGSTGEGSKPIDMALSRGDRFLYVLDSGTASLSAFRVGGDGALTAAGTTTGLPATAVGLAAQ